jgi:hypothetical protein
MPPPLQFLPVRLVLEHIAQRARENPQDTEQLRQQARAVAVVSRSITSAPLGEALLPAERVRQLFDAATQNSLNSTLQEATPPFAESLLDFESRSGVVFLGKELTSQATASSADHMTASDSNSVLEMRSLNDTLQVLAYEHGISNSEFTSWSGSIANAFALIRSTGQEPPRGVAPKSLQRFLTAPLKRQAGHKDLELDAARLAVIVRRHQELSGHEYVDRNALDSPKFTKGHIARNILAMPAPFGAINKYLASTARQSVALKQELPRWQGSLLSAAAKLDIARWEQPNRDIGQLCLDSGLSEPDAQRVLQAISAYQDASQQTVATTSGSLDLPRFNPFSSNTLEWQHVPDAIKWLAVNGHLPNRLRKMGPWSIQKALEVAPGEIATNAIDREGALKIRALLRDRPATLTPSTRQELRSSLYRSLDALGQHFHHQVPTALFERAPGGPVLGIDVVKETPHEVSKAEEWLRNVAVKRALVLRFGDSWEWQPITPSDLSEAEGLLTADEGLTETSRRDLSLAFRRSMKDFADELPGIEAIYGKRSSVVPPQLVGGEEVTAGEFIDVLTSVAARGDKGDKRRLWISRSILSAHGPNWRSRPLSPELQRESISDAHFARIGEEGISGASTYAYRHQFRSAVAVVSQAAPKRITDALNEDVETPLLESFELGHPKFGTLREFAESLTTSSSGGSHQGKSRVAKRFNEVLSRIGADDSQPVTAGTFEMVNSEDSPLSRELRAAFNGVLVLHQAATVAQHQQLNDNTDPSTISEVRGAVSLIDFPVPDLSKRVKSEAGKQIEATTREQMLHEKRAAEVHTSGPLPDLLWTRSRTEETLRRILPDSSVSEIKYLADLKHHRQRALFARQGAVQIHVQASNDSELFAGDEGAKIASAAAKGNVHLHRTEAGAMPVTTTTRYALGDSETDEPNTVETVAEPGGLPRFVIEAPEPDATSRAIDDLRVQEDFNKPGSGTRDSIGVGHLDDDLPADKFLNLEPPSQHLPNVDPDNGLGF